MIISVKENTVFGVFHPDAYDLFNTCSDLKKVAWELWNPNYRLNDKVRLSSSNCTILILMTVFRIKLGAHCHRFNLCADYRHPPLAFSLSDRLFELAAPPSAL